VVKIKYLESNPWSEFDSYPEKEKKIIDVEPSAMVNTTNIQSNEIEEPEEGEHLFHS
jgi:hypothetical protein